MLHLLLINRPIHPGAVAVRLGACQIHLIRCRIHQTLWLCSKCLSSGPAGLPLTTSSRRLKALLLARSHGCGLQGGLCIRTQLPSLTSMS